MASSDEEFQLFRRHKAFLKDFLEYDGGDGTYGDRVRSLLARRESRLMLDLNDLRRFNRLTTSTLLKDPNQFIPAFESALLDYVKQVVSDEEAGPLKSAEELLNRHYTVGFVGSFGSHHLTPRGLSTSFVRNLVCIEGIVTKCSIIRPKVVKSVHYCHTTNQYHWRSYRDQVTSSGIPSAAIYPTKDEHGNPLETEFGWSNYKDYQRLTLQEMPERAPAGQLPRSVDVIFENDLVDRVKPGDRVLVAGVYRAFPISSFGSHTQSIFKTLLVANSIQPLGHELQGALTEEDITNIKEQAGRPDIFSRLSQSLAPSIYGHEFIKKAILLQLFGGVEKNLHNGTHLRGDINVLMVGDPSTAKSQMLRFVLGAAPLAISTSGRGSSGVGLTAAVVSDSDTGERRLEAGAMVLADRGVVCIDEFDKMSEEDRVAIHEVMEQQTVTIAKAGIHTSLNARCSVLAAANPIYGQYDRSRPPAGNIRLPDSLLSRFDLLFVVLDELSSSHDRKIADHVLRMHRYREKGGAGASHGGSALLRSSGPADLALIGSLNVRNAEGPTPVTQRYDVGELYSIPFVRKYVMYAKNRVRPRLSPEAERFIQHAWADFRGGGTSGSASHHHHKTMPVTVRTLETLIRLAEAHAKLRLAPQVEESDAEVAADVLHFALFHDDRRKPGDISVSGEEEAEGSTWRGAGEGSPRIDEQHGGAKRRRILDGDHQASDEEGLGDGAAMDVEMGGEDEGASSLPITMSSRQKEVLQRGINHLARINPVVTLNDALGHANEQLGSDHAVTLHQAQSLLREWHQRGVLYYEDGDGEGVIRLIS